MDAKVLVKIADLWNIFIRINLADWELLKEDHFGDQA